MKYLKLHILFLWIMVLLYTIIDAIIWFCEYIIAFLWTFDYEPIFKAWKIAHTKSDILAETYNDYSDNNIIQSFNRRWNEVKEVLKLNKLK